MNWLFITSLLLAALSVAHAINCYGPSSKLNLKDFDVFPSPVSPGERIYARANLKPTSEITSAKVNIRVYYSDSADIDDELDPIVQIDNVDFCTLSEMVTCPLKATSTILAWDFLVPSVPPGTYQVQYEIKEDNPADGNPNSCIQFPITVAGIRTNKLNSHYQAILQGTAVFTNPDYSKRTVGDSVQVGPLGPLGIASPAYGQIKNLKGTGDLVPNPYYETANFVWGMNGTLETQAVSSTGVSHTYTGTCYLGYIGGGYTYNHNSPLITGTFTLTWSYKNTDTAQVSGTARFDPDATIPVGWGFPILYGRLGDHQVVTSDSGFLMITGSLTKCADGGVCSSPPPNERGGGSGGLSSSKLGIAIGIPLAALFVAFLVGAVFFFLKRRKETEQEDGIFAVARKPEYGSALVVDDIIEESRGSKTLQSMLDVKDEYSEPESDDESDRSGSDRRGRSRTPVSRSVSRSRSRSSSGEHSRDDSDAGESADRGSDSE